MDFGEKKFKDLKKFINFEKKVSLILKKKPSILKRRSSIFFYEFDEKFSILEKVHQV